MILSSSLRPSVVSGFLVIRTSSPIFVLHATPISTRSHYNYGTEKGNININWKMIQFSRNTTNNLLSIYKSGNMFRLIEPSSGQFTNHTEGTLSRCAHCGISNAYKTYDNTRYKWLFGSQYFIIKLSQYVVIKYFKLTVLRLKCYSSPSSSNIIIQLIWSFNRPVPFIVECFIVL